jgi:hypothetical protein
VLGDAKANELCDRLWSIADAVDLRSLVEATAKPT